MTTDTSEHEQSTSKADEVAGPYADMWARPGFLIRRLHQIQVGLFTEECREFDITPIQFGFLTVLYEEKALDQITLSAAVGVDRTSGADVIKRLQRRGLLTRVQSQRDRRAKRVQITEQGRLLVKRMYPSMVRSQQRFIEPLTPAEQKSFNQLLRKLIHANDSASRATMSKDFWARGDKASKG